MSEQAPRDTEPQFTAGGMLKAARQAQGIQLVSLATQLKIAPRKLEALENDQLEELQGPTFVRALAQAACRVLKIDPVPVLARLPRHESSTLEQVSGGLNAPFKERGGNRVLAQWVSENRWVLALGSALVLGALILFLAPPGFGLNSLRATATAAVEQAASAGVAAAELTASAVSVSPSVHHKRRPPQPPRLRCRRHLLRRYWLPTCRRGLPRQWHWRSPLLRQRPGCRHCRRAAV